MIRDEHVWNLTAENNGELSDFLTIAKSMEDAVANMRDVYPMANPLGSFTIDTLNKDIAIAEAASLGDDKKAFLVFQVMENMSDVKEYGATGESAESVLESERNRNPNAIIAAVVSLHDLKVSRERLEEFRQECINKEILDKDNHTIH